MSTVRMLKPACVFLFNAMAPKQIDGFLFQGIPKMIYLDNGPIARSHVFQQVMRYLDIDVRAEFPAGSTWLALTDQVSHAVTRGQLSVRADLSSSGRTFAPRGRVAFASIGTTSRPETGLIKVALRCFL